MFFFAGPTGPRNLTLANRGMIEGLLDYNSYIGTTGTIGTKGVLVTCTYINSRVYLHSLCIHLLKAGIGHFCPENSVPSAAEQWLSSDL